MQHTVKFVTFAPDNHPHNTICILPKSLTIASPPVTTPPAPRASTATKDRIALPAANNDQERTPGQREQDNIAYDNLAKTAKFPIANKFVSFTCTFCYLGSLINYSLRNNKDIAARIASATAAMGASKEIWRNPHLNIYNKYLLFQAIPMNLLLWVAETWSLCKSQLNQLEVFLHCSIRQIFQILISQVQEDRIQNEKVRKMFYLIPCVRNMIAARQAEFIGKMIRAPPNRPSRNMITACCNHKRRVGRPQTTGKKFMVEDLRLLFQDVDTIHIDQFGLLRD
jgi:hypothetical protein